LLLARFWLLFIGCLVNSPDQKAMAAGACTFVTACSFYFQMKNNPFDEPLADRPSRHGLGTHRHTSIVVAANCISGATRFCHGSLHA
jgi:hypothetical protein